MFNKKMFTLESLNKEYEGYTSGAKLNGNECPLFTKEVAKQILRDANITWHFEERGCCFIYQLERGRVEHKNGVLCFTSKNVRQRLYSIGYSDWPWQLVTKDSTEFVDKFEESGSYHIRYNTGEEELWYVDVERESINVLTSNCATFDGSCVMYSFDDLEGPMSHLIDTCEEVKRTF